MKRDGISGLTGSPSVDKEQAFSIKDVSQSLKVAFLFFFFFLFSTFCYEPNSGFDEYKHLNFRNVIKSFQVEKQRYPSAEPEKPFENQG